MSLFAVDAEDFGPIDHNRMVFTVLLLAILFDLHHRCVLHQRGSVLRAMLASIVILELLLEVEIVFSAFILVYRLTSFAVFCIVSD